MPPMILGLDPGFEWTGWALARLERRRPRITNAGTFRTQKSTRKRGVLVADDNYRRAKEIAAWLHGMLADHCVSMVCAEAMSAPRHASSAAKVAMAWGVIAAECLGHPVATISPQALKKAATGRVKVSDVELHAALANSYPEAAFIEEFPKNRRPHAWDAVGAIHGCRNGELMLTLQQVAG